MLEITQAQLDEALRYYVEELVSVMDITFTNHGITPQYVVVPAETCIFGRNDFYQVLDSAAQRAGRTYKVVPVIETESDAAYVFFSWV